MVEPWKFTQQLRNQPHNLPIPFLHTWQDIRPLINACNARNVHVQIADEESVDSSTGDRSNYDFCNILSTLDLQNDKTLERSYSNPIRGRNTVNDTNDLPKGATTIRSRKRGLQQRQEQRKHQLH